MASVYEELGVRAGINARGNQTLLGGSTPPPEVQAAMDEANSAYIVFEELLRKSGEFIAETLGTEAAFVTSGAAAAIALGSAAALAGDDREKMGKIPDTSGMKNEFVFQKCQDYSYKRCFTIPGGVVVEVGDEEGCTPGQLEAGIGPNTVAIAYFENGRWGDDVVSVDEARDIAHRRGLPLVVDAASQIYPLDHFQRVSQAGDVVAFGAKYFGSPHSTGICAGKADLVESAFQQNFIGFEIAGQKGFPRTFGRPFKTDRSEVIGVVAALRRWFTMNHEDRLAMEDAKRNVIAGALSGVPGVSTVIPREPPIGPTIAIHIVVDESVVGKSARQAIDELESADTPIWLGARDDKSISVGVQVLTDEQAQVVADRLKETLGG